MRKTCHPASLPGGILFYTILYEEGDFMREYIDYVNRLCCCGMRVDDAYTVCHDFYRELDFDGLEDYVSRYEVIHNIVNAYVD